MPKNNTEEPTSWEIHIRMRSKDCDKHNSLISGAITCKHYARKDKLPHCIKSLCPRVYER